MIFSMIGAIIGGVSSALISHGPLYESPYHFGVFLICTFVAMGVGTIIDNLIK